MELEKSRIVRADFLMLITAAIWGTTFVAQRIGMAYVGPFTFTAVRFALGASILLPFAIISKMSIRRDPYSFQQLLKRGILAGSILFIAANSQQIGVIYTTAARGGFITGLYVILVPILGFFVGYRPGPGGWSGAIVALIGLYLLSITGPLTLAHGDAWVFAGTFFWAAHVLLIGRFSPRSNPIKLACIQFYSCSILSFIGALITETMMLSSILQTLFPILYGGVCSVGIAYTLQVVAQRDAPPVHAAIILSLETVFSAIGGWIILHETMTSRALIGCALMLAGMLLAQIWTGKKQTTIS